MEDNKLTTVEGVIQAIIYKSDDSGYTVAKALLPDGEEITLVGLCLFWAAANIFPPRVSW